MECHIYDSHDLEKKTILYVPRFNEYGIPCEEDGVSMIMINYCPWCGRKLPNSLRDKWFDEVLSLGFENPLFDENIPIAYKTAAWWNNCQSGDGSMID